MKSKEQEAMADWEDNSMSLYQFSKKWGIDLKKIFPELVEDEEEK